MAFLSILLLLSSVLRLPVVVVAFAVVAVLVLKPEPTTRTLSKHTRRYPCCGVLFVFRRVPLSRLETMN